MDFLGARRLAKTPLQPTSGADVVPTFDSVPDRVC